MRYIMIEYKYDSKTIEKKRDEISKEFINKSVNIKSTDINRLSATDIKILFELYDGIFLNHWFKDNFKGQFKFSVSSRMTKSAGLTFCPKNMGILKEENVTIEIRIGVNFFFQYDSLEGNK